MNRPVLMKILITALLALALLIPVSMIRELIAERQARSTEAVAGIAQGWGKRQTVAGPYLVVPYERTWIEVSHETIGGVRKERRVERTQASVLRLPADRVEWTLDASTTEKTRGIYKARLYTARISAAGRIKVPPSFGLTADRVRFGVPKIVVGVSDPVGLRSVTPLRFGDGQAEFLPGAGDSGVPSGVHALVPLAAASEAREFRFGFGMELAGSEALAVAPLARDTSVAMRADWPHPSFQGLFLPSELEQRPDGFRATWQVSRYAAQNVERLARCPEPCSGLMSQELGAAFIEPVSIYQQLERASKYGFLFIGITFAAFILLELLRRLVIHPVQYTLVGLALAMFFLLLTALSEHMTFGAAYAAATFSCVGLVTVYAVRVLGSRSFGFAFGAALAALFATLYLLLKAEDYSLLGGSVLLFVLLAGIMIATRKIDWYRLTAAAEARGR